MSLSGELTGVLESELKQILGSDCRISGFHPVGGGCIHHSGRLATSAGPFFLKHNQPIEFANFQAEAQGLSLIASGPLRVPQVLGHGQSPSAAFLLLEWIEPGRPGIGFWQDFGRNLAGLHRLSHSHFGLSTDNFIGRLPQSNTFRENWVDFFTEERLRPQLELAQSRQLVEADLVRRFEKLFQRLPVLIPDSPPSLLHGDLWSGNFLCDLKNRAVLVDPAVYYGHREAEIAFTKLFGGFASEFYHSYQEAWPLEKGWEERVNLFNLYPLAVHLNLFGRGYLPDLQSILYRYT